MKHTVLLVVAALLAAACAGAAQAGDEHPDNVTLCHASGLAGTTKYETITVGYPAAFGPAGHFSENGTPNAGHEQDYLGECHEQPPVDVCPNLEGDQSEVPPGYHLGDDENGRQICIQDEQPPDVCPNLEGNQAQIPDGYQLVDGQCVLIPPPPDVCPNIDGAQAQVPAGMVVDANGNCVTPTPPAPSGGATVICLLPAGIYQLSGTVDGQTANKVEPATLPGSTKGVTQVVVTRGDTSVRTAVSTLGDCGTITTVTVVPPAAPPTAAPPVTTPPVVKPVVKPKPKLKPPVKHNKPVKHKKPVKPVKHKPNKKPHKAPQTLSL